MALSISTFIPPLEADVIMKASKNIEISLTTVASHLNSETKLRNYVSCFHVNFVKHMDGGFENLDALPRISMRSLMSGKVRFVVVIQNLHIACVSLPPHVETTG